LLCHREVLVGEDEATEGGDGWGGRGTEDWRKAAACRCPHETTFAGKVAAEWGGAGGGRRGLANLQF